MIEEKDKLKNTQIAKLKHLKKRFSFVGDNILRENIIINTQYVTFLRSLGNNYKLPRAATYSVYKTIILYTASIVESLINYKLKKLIKEGKIENNKIMSMEEKYIHIADLYNISSEEKVCGIRKIKRHKKLVDETIFIDLNKAAKRCGLFDRRLFKKSEKLRKMRNKIHLSALSNIDDRYSQEDIDNSFEIAKDVINRIEKY